MIILSACRALCGVAVRKTHLFGFLFEESFEGNFLESAGEAGVMTVELLVGLLAGYGD